MMGSIEPYKSKQLRCIEQDQEANGCRCPPGFKGDGVHTCEGMKASAEIGWSIFCIIFLALGAVGVGGYAVYKHRFRGYMDSEIRAIMAQYMPLDNNNAEATAQSNPPF